ncbi:MAG: T9SS type A sorting domain-containing protein [Bacteroidales bacterium]|nr:T9SS type A sorting domain-containing protein [Bacteroidales bacterium]
MKQTLLLILFLLCMPALHSQNDTISIARSETQKSLIRENNTSLVTIFPVPVRQNNFTIRTEKEMTLVKVTNMIGQDIFRAQYKNPVPSTKVLLKKPTRGMYLVTISFVDGTRVVRKIMIENPE